MRQLDREWTEAYKNRDAEALKRILADNFIFTDDEGKVYNKEQYIAAVVQFIKLEAYRTDDLIIRVYGDTGIVAGQATYTMTINGKDASGVIRYTDTSLKRPGGWQGIASQDTRVAKKAAQ